MSGFLYPSNTFVNGAMHAGMMQFGGADTNLMWGPPQLGRWKWHDPTVHAQLLVDNNTRLWVFCTADADRQRPGRDDRLRRPGAGQQPVVLRGTTAATAAVQRALRLPDER